MLVPTSLVEANAIKAARDVDGPGRNAEDVLPPESLLRVYGSYGHCSGKRRGDDDGDEVEGVNQDIAEGGGGRLDLGDDRVGEADEGEASQEANELVRVLLELEVDRWRVHDGPDEIALGGHEAGAEDHGQRLLFGVVAGLDHFGAAEQGVPIKNKKREVCRHIR